MRASATAGGLLLLVITVGCGGSATDPPPGGSYSGTVRADAPVVYWRFEEQSGTIASDSSGFDRQGTYISTPLLGAAVGAPHTGVGVSLQNDSDGVTAAAASWNDLQTLSVEAWVRPSRVTSDEGMIIVDKGAVWNLLIYRDGRPAFQTPGGLPETRAVGPVQAGATYHLVGTCGGDVMKLYVNGVLVSEATAQALIESVPTPVHVGRGMSPERWEFYGVVDEVAIYDKVLEADAVLRHYQAGT